jgi:tRNA A37 methylthiotransferase MiaB
MSSVSDTPDKANTIILLCCQVTDLSVLNDIKQLELLMEKYPNKHFYVSGCLARRFDVALPAGVKRLETPYSDITPIQQTNLVHWQAPFWVKDWTNSVEETSSGNLVRNRYPLRISVGCRKKCAYCTIRVTRGTPRDLPVRLEELKDHPHAVLVADSPSSDLLTEWLAAVNLTKTPVAIRNVEPDVAIAIWDKIEETCKNGLLDVLHVPVQSNQANVLKAMNRNIDATQDYIQRASMLRGSTLLATNIIVDYMDYPNPTHEVYDIFDVVNWNPYWDGVWNRQSAERRWKQYFPWK